MAKKPSKKTKYPGRFNIPVPDYTYEAIRSRVTADRSMSAICLDLIHEYFAPGLPAPERLEVMFPQADEKWPRIAVYCADEVRKRVIMEMKRRRGPVVQDRPGRPRDGAAAAIAWLLTQRYIVEAK